MNQGIILGEDGRKMSKRWGNVIDPLDVIADYGADAFRCYEMFMGPLEQMKPWSMTGVEGVSRFLARVWRLMMEENQAGEWLLAASLTEVEPDTRAAQGHARHDQESDRRHRGALLQYRDRADDDFRERLHHRGDAPGRGHAHLAHPPESLRAAPHLGALGIVRREISRSRRREITDQSWPEFRAEFLVEDEVEMAIQVNGKVRDRARVPIAATTAELEALALANPRVQEFIAGLTVRKVVVIPKEAWSMSSPADRAG